MLGRSEAGSAVPLQTEVHVRSTSQSGGLRHLRFHGFARRGRLPDGSACRDRVSRTGRGPLAPGARIARDTAGHVTDVGVPARLGRTAGLRRSVGDALPRWRLPSRVAAFSASMSSSCCPAVITTLLLHEFEGDRRSWIFPAFWGHRAAVSCGSFRRAGGNIARVRGVSAG